jgi:transcriptional regulator with XRE-family HTH domain
MTHYHAILLTMARDKLRMLEKLAKGYHLASQRAALEKIGPSLFGSAWQSDLARALGVTDRTVRRWFAGEHVMSRETWEEVAKLAGRRSSYLAATVTLAESIASKAPTEEERKRDSIDAAVKARRAGRP